MYTMFASLPIGRRLSRLGSACLVASTVSAAAAQVPLPGSSTQPATQTQGGDKMLTGTVRHSVIPADQLLGQGKYADAEEMFRQQLVANPQDVPATVGLGTALAKQFKLDGAEELFDRVLSTDPTNALAHAGKATCALNRLQSSSGTIRSQKDSILRYAEDEARRACTLAPASGECHYTLGAVLREQARTQDAGSEFRNAINFDPNHSFAYSGLGNINLEQGSTAEAAANFRRSIELNSGNSSAHYGLGVALLRQNMVDEAIKELNISLYQFPNSAPVRQALGEAYHKQGNTAAALKEYQMSIMIKPENPDPYLRISDIREQRGDLEMALADLRSGLGQLPYNLDLRMKIADTLLKLEKADDAIKSFRTVLSMSPNNPQAVKGLTQSLYIKAQKAAAGALLASNDYEAAIHTLEDAVKLNPDDMELRLAQAKLMSLAGTKLDLSSVGEPKSDGQKMAYAEALMAQGDFQQAGTQVADVVSRLSDAKQAFAVADLATMMHDLDNAEAAYKKAQALSGAPERVERGLSDVAKQRKASIDEVKVAGELVNKKQFDGAAERYRHALATNPRQADARLGLARSLEKMKKPTQSAFTDAAQQYRYYVSLRPDLPAKDREKLLEEATKLNAKAAKLAMKPGGRI